MGSNGLMDWKETSSNTNRMAYEKKKNNIIMVNRVGAIPFDCRCKQDKWTWSVVVVGGDGDDDDDDVDDDYDRLTYMYKVIYKRTHYTSVKSIHDNSSTTQLNS